MHFYNLWEGDYNPFKIFKVDPETTKPLEIGHNFRKFVKTHYLMSDIQDQKKKKKCKIDQYFLQFFESNTTVCLIIHGFHKSFEFYKNQNQKVPKKGDKNNFTFANLTKHVNQHCCPALEILKKILTCLSHLFSWSNECPT